jgi:endonuclease/exonuclease/phosphatase (EEP) superfamily protein YafD
VKGLLFSFVGFLGRLIIAAAWVFAVALTLWNVLRIYPGDRWLLVRLGNYFAPWLFMALVPALIVAVLARRPWLMRVALLLALVFVVRYWPLLLPRLSVLSAGDTVSELRVMTFNVKYANRNVSDIADLIRAESPDVVAMQELKRGLAAPLRAELASEYPYFLYDSSQSLTGLISRYPLTAGAVLPELRYSRSASVETPAGPVTVWSVHLAVALSQPGWEAQRRMATAVAEMAEENGGPLVVMGDFNTTDQTENYGLVADKLTDVHWSVGRGFGFTFPDLGRNGTDSPVVGPVVRIDHIFVSEHLTPQGIQVIPSGHGSDHRPVVATLRFNGR